MAKVHFGVSPTSVVLRAKLMDSSVSTGAGLTSLTFSATGLRISTIQIGEVSATSYTAAGSTIETIATLGTYAAPTATKCRFREVDATNHPGLYEVHLADARFASTGSLIVSISGATNLAQADLEIQCSNLASNMTQILGTAVSTPATAGILDVNVKNMNNVAATSITAINANIGQTQPLNFTGTGASATVKSDMVNIAGAAVSTSTAQIGVNVIQAAGTAWGSGAITAASIATGAITNAKFAAGAIDAAAIAADAIGSSEFAQAAADKIWASATRTLTSLSLSAAVDANIVSIMGASVSTSAAQLGVNVIQAAGTAWGSGAITAASIATGAITNAKFAAGAIDGAAIAAGAIGADEFAQAAADKIWASATRTLTSLAGLSATANVVQVDGVALSTHATGMFPSDLRNIIGTAVSTPATAGILDVNVKNMNNVAATSITTINANQGTTQPVNYTGTGATAYVKSDMVNIAGAAVSTSAAQLGVNVIQAAGTAWGSGAITAAVLATDCITVAKIANNAITSAKLAVGVIEADAFAAGAITADAIAADAIGASEFAQAAADKIWLTTSRILTSATNITSTGGTVPITAAGYVSSDIIRIENVAFASHTAGYVPAEATIAGTMNANLISIDGQATSATSATLNLKQLNIVNSTGDAFIATSTFSAGAGIKATGSGSGAGLYVQGGNTSGNGIDARAGTNTGSGISAQGGGTLGSGITVVSPGGNGIHIVATTNGSGIYAKGNGVTGHGMRLEGDDCGLYVESGSSGTAAIYALGVNAATGFKSEGGSTGAGIIATAGATSGAGLSLIGTGAGKDLLLNTACNNTVLAANMVEISGNVVSTSAAQIGTNVVSMAAGTITAAVIATGAIDADAIADNAIDAGSIATGAITNAKFAAGAIDAAAIADNAIDAGSIATGAITNAKFAAGAIDAAAIAADAIGASEFAQAAADKIWLTTSRILTSATNITSTGGTVPITAAGYVSSDVTAISTDTTAADNLESQFDTTGLTGDAYPARQDQLQNIVATGAAINSPATGFVLSAGVQAAGTYLNTVARDGVIHQLQDSAGTLNCYYEFDIGQVGVPTAFQIFMANTGTNDTIRFFGWNWVTSAWIELASKAGTTGITYSSQTVPMYTSMVGTGANIGKVWVRLFNTGLSTANVYVDQIFVSYAIVNQSVGYADGAVWLDTIGGISGTTPYINGTADRPCLTYADALTIAAAVGIHKYTIVAGSTITLTATHDYDTFIGSGGQWTLNLNGQSIAGAYFEDVNVSGTGTGATPPTFRYCSINSGTTLPPAFFDICGFNTSAAFVAGAAGQYLFNDCMSLVPGSGTPQFNFSGTGGTTGINIRRWSGGTNITLDSNCTATIEVVTGGGQTIAANGANVEIRGICRAVTLTGITSATTAQIACVTGPVSLAGADGTVRIYGVCATVTDSRTGSPTLVNQALSQVTIPDVVWDEIRSGHTTSATFGEYTNANLTYVDSVANATHASGMVPADARAILGTAVATPATAGILDVNVKNMNNVAATSITTINANQGTTQPVNYTGTGASATVKTDLVNIAGAAVATSAAQIGVNVVSQNNIDFGALQKTSLNAATPASVGSVTSPVTVGTNNDKINYTLSASEHTAIGVDAATAILITPANKLDTDVSGLVNIGKVYSVSAAAQKLSISAPTMMTGTVTSAALTPTTAQFECADITEAGADFYKYRTVIFTSGNLNHQARNITAYSKVGSNGRFTVDPLTEAPVNGDTIIIV